MPQLSSRDVSIVITVKDAKSLFDFLFGISVLHLARHHSKKFYKHLSAAKVKSTKGLKTDIPGKSIVPLLSTSTSLIISASSASEGFWPRLRMTVPNSLVVIWPEERKVRLVGQLLSELVTKA